MAVLCDPDNDVKGSKVKGSQGHTAPPFMSGPGQVGLLTLSLLIFDVGLACRAVTKDTEPLPWGGWYLQASSPALCMSRDDKVLRPDIVLREFTSL